MGSPKMNLAVRNWTAGEDVGLRGRRELVVALIQR
jgi:hypothetical protein